MSIVDDNPQVKVKCIEFIDTGASNTPFIRNYVYDECGELTSTFDIDQDGNPYTVVGPFQKQNAGTTILDVTGIETTTTLVDNLDGTFTYINENSTPVTFTVGQSDHGALTGLGDDDHTQYLTEARHDALPFDNPHQVTAAQTGSETSAQLDVRDAANRDRVNHTGTQTASTISDFSAAVQAAETVTSLAGVGNTLEYTKEDGTTDIVDLSSLLGDTFSVYEVFQTGTTSFTTTYQQVPMNTEESSQAGYSIVAGAVQVADVGRYKITYSMSADGTDNDRAISRSAIFINGSELVRSRSFAYHRNTASGEGTATKTIITTLAASDIVDLRSLIFGDNVTTIDQTSSIVVEKIG